MKSTLGPNASFMQRKLQKLWQLRLARLQSLLQPKQFFLLRLLALYLHSPDNKVGLVPSAHGFVDWRPDNEQCRLYAALHKGDKPCQSLQQRLHGLWLAQSPSGWLNPKGVFKFWLFTDALSSDEQQQLEQYCQQLSLMASELNMIWHIDIIQSDAQQQYLLPRLWPDNRKQLLDGIFLAGRVPNWFYLEYGEAEHPELLQVVEGPKDLQLANWVAKQLRASLAHPLKSPPWLAEALLLLKHYPNDYLDAHRRRQEIQTQPAEKLLDIGFHFAKRLALDLPNYRHLINDACYLGIGIVTSQPSVTTDWRTLMARQWANQQLFSHKHRAFLDQQQLWGLSDYLHWQQSLLALWQDCADQLLVFCQAQQIHLPAILDLLAEVSGCRAHDRLLAGFQGRIEQPDVQLLAYQDGWRWMTPDGHEGPSEPFLSLAVNGILQKRVGADLPTCTPQAPISQAHWQQLVQVIHLWQKQPLPCFILVDHQQLSGLIALNPKDNSPTLYSGDLLDQQGLREALTCRQPLVVIGHSERCQWWPLYQRAGQQLPQAHGRWLVGSGIDIRLLDLGPEGIQQHFIEDQQHLMQLLGKPHRQWQPLQFSTHAKQKWPQLAALYAQHRAGDVLVLLLNQQPHQLECLLLDESGRLVKLSLKTQQWELRLQQLLSFLNQHPPAQVDPSSSWLQVFQYQLDRQGSRLKGMAIHQPHSAAPSLPTELNGRESSSELASLFAQLDD